MALSEFGEHRQMELGREGLAREEVGDEEDELLLQRTVANLELIHVFVEKGWVR